jgi:hypothetical protein
MKILDTEEFIVFVLELCFKYEKFYDNKFLVHN